MRAEASNWQRVPLVELCEKHVDCVNRTAPVISGPTPFKMIRTTIVRDGYIDTENVRYVTEDTYKKWTRRLVPKPGDVILTREAPLGGVGKLRTNDYIFLGQRLYHFRPHSEKLDSDLLLYALMAPDLQGQIMGFGSGSTVEHMRLGDIPSLEITIPPLPVQRRIAGILSAYDELIENSQRRIRLLEDMARALYREWFIHFRFPGNEPSPQPSPKGRGSHGDIPQGWEVTDLAAVCADDKGIQTGPFGSQLHEADYSDEGVPVVMPKDLIGFRIRTDSIAHIPVETAEKLSRHRMKPGDIVYGRRGDIGRRAYIMPHQSGWFCGTGCLRIRPDPKKVNGWYLFNYLGQHDVVKLIAGRAQGVTMPNLNTGLLSSVPIVLPPRDIQDQFGRLSFPFAQAQEALHARIENLRRTRDLLLPRLLSGECSVSNTPINP